MHKIGEVEVGNALGYLKKLIEQIWGQNLAGRGFEKTKFHYANKNTNLSVHFYEQENAYNDHKAHFKQLIRQVC